MNCEHCNDSGSRTKELWDDLDCVHCNTAVERTAFNDWLKQRRKADDIGEVHEVDAWIIYQRGKAAGAVEVARS